MTSYKTPDRLLFSIKSRSKWLEIFFSGASILKFQEILEKPLNFEKCPGKGPENVFITEVLVERVGNSP